MFSRKWFLNLEQELRNAGLDSDARSFDQIKTNLQIKKQLSASAFASQTIYVILAGGFSQKTAKKKHAEIIKYIKSAGNLPVLDNMLCIFNNKNKMNAVIKIWQDRISICQDYYALIDLDSKLKFLSSLPHIGKITSNHLARNLGENVVKYDIWIQRLGVVHAMNPALLDKVNNGNLNPDIKLACDDMFESLERETGLPRGYIDVVLWRACQNGYIKFNGDIK